MSASQGEKATRFRKLHEGPKAFVIANAWDASSALAHARAICAASRISRTSSGAFRPLRKPGADVLFAPGLPDLAAVRTVCSALQKPFNFMVGIRGKSFSVAELEAAGVRRISLATSLYRAAMSGLVSAAKEVQERGTFGYLDSSLSASELNSTMRI